MSTDFEQMVTGVPATQDDVSVSLRAQLQTQGSRIGNTSPFSPFFVLLGVLFGSAVLYLRDLVLNSILPGLFVKTATGAFLDVQADGYDETRRQPSKAIGEITFHRIGTTGDLSIPSGTIVASPPIAGIVYRVITSAVGTIPEGETSARVPVLAEAVGAAYNLGAGYYSILPVVVAGVTQVENESDWLTTPGADLEDDDTLRTRLKLKWRRVSGWHTEDTYRSLISDKAGISPDDIFFDLAAPRGPGSADAYILTSAGIPSDDLVTATNAFINDEGNHGLGDDLQVKAIAPLNVTIVVGITATAEATSDDKTALQTGVETLIRAAFRENSAFPDVPRVAPFKRVSRSALTAAIMDNFPLAEAVDFTTPSTDPIPDLELPILAALTVSVS